MKFIAKTVLSLIPFTLLVGSLGCSRRVGPPDDREELMRPEEVASFDRLYSQNCSACHGTNGSGGPALDLANPKYQALFGDSAGGLLTPQQIDILVAGMRARWNRTGNNAAEMPPYFSSTVGNVDNAQDIFDTSCSTCHKQGRQGIGDPSFLALVSDQSLRTIVIAGRPDLGHPDWKQVRPSQPLTGQDVSDVVMYLHSLRTDTPGQPYPETSPKR